MMAHALLPELGRQRQRDLFEFEAGLTRLSMSSVQGYIVIPNLNKEEKGRGEEGREGEKRGGDGMGGEGKGGERRGKERRLP